MSVALRTRLGEEAARDLEKYAESLGSRWRDEVMDTASERFDNRLATVASDLRQEMAGLRADLRTEMAGTCADLRGEIADMATGLRAEMQQGFERIWKAMADLGVGLRRELADARVETFRWSCVFWIGQVAVLISVLTFMLRGVIPR
jgi:hypothetical protein